GCASAPSGQTMISHRQDGRDTIPGWIEACPTDFGADEPDWDTVLDRLVAAHVFSLPDPRTLTPPGLGVLDGVHLQVETLEGDRYRTYRYAEPWDQPWPEARDAEAIMDVVRELEPPLRGDPGEAGPAPPPPMPEPRQETDCPPEAPLPPAEVVVRPAATPSGSPFVEIVGSVVEADTARAVAHARVAWSQRSGGDSVQADEGGVFRIRVRADEPVTLAIGSLGFRVRRDTLRVTRDTEVSARFPMVFFVLDRCGFGPVIR
ncbi:MAG TPA: hypothetical protein VLA43_19800, partial [Longimicrobiales bacterium]|nr:hypothetical protein [Longimicrobiales bacterium]